MLVFLQHMNFMTPDACYCGFPHGTLQRKGLIKNTPLRERDEAAIHKYEARNFTLARDEWTAAPDDPSIWDRDYFGDVALLWADFRWTAAPDNTHISPIRRAPRGWRLTREHPPISSVS